MKQFFTNIKAVVTAVVTMAVVAGSVSSCSYDDTKIWNEINGIKKELASLRTTLDTIFGSTNGIVSGALFIVDVEQRGDGSKVVTLSDGSKLTVYARGGGLTGIVTTVTIDDVLYWAVYMDDTAQPVLVNGNMVPVATVKPQTNITEDGVIQVSFDGGETWIDTGYTESITDTIISDVEIVYSDWQTDSEGNPVGLYCIVTFSDGSTMKVGMQNGRIILPYDSLFVPYGNTLPFAINVSDVADYIYTLPKGWECEVEHKAKLDSMLLTFLAPTREAVASGAAVGEGVAKLMVVFNNGSSAIASIKLSTSAADIDFTQDGVYLNVGYGTNYLLCGIFSASSYKAETIADLCQTVLGGGTSQYVYEVAFMETHSTFIPYSELRSSSLTAGTEYVFWYVVPRTNENDENYVVTEEICSEIYMHSSVKFKVKKASFFDVTIDFDVKGSADYMLGYALAEEFDAEALAEYYTENPDYLNATNSDIDYTGSLLELFSYNNEALNEDTNYVAWYIAKPRNNRVLVDNVLYWEFSTAAFTTGGDIESQAKGKPNVGYDFIEVTLGTVEKHIAFFYNVMPSYMASYSNDEQILEMLLSEGTKIVSEEDVVARYEGADAGEAYTFFAVAVDAEGKYGKPFQEEFQTKAIEYNRLSLELQLVDYKIDNTRVKVNCDGASSYCYVMCKTADEKLWVNRYGGTAKKAGEYMIKHYDESDVVKVSTLEDGHLVFAGLEMGVEYVLVVAAVDADGLLSQPKAEFFSPIANIGTMVKRTDANWAEGKPLITLGETGEVEFFNFAWYTTPQKGYVAYSLADHPGNLVSDYFGTNVNTPEKLIAYIIANCDNGKRDCGHKCEYSEDGYSHVWKEMEDLNGDGRIDMDEWVEHREDNLPGVYNFFFYGTKEEHRIYVTWVGEDGNYHEPFVFNPTTGLEEELNADNFPGYF